MMGSNMPPTISTTVVCVDQRMDGDLQGSFVTPYLRDPQAFSGVMQMVDIMDHFFDWAGFPQAYHSNRKFVEDREEQPPCREGETERYMDDEMLDQIRGKLATFVIQVQFRQNSSWQGAISWTEKRMTHRFRSTLELLKLMDSAVQGEEDVELRWE